MTTNETPARRRVWTVRARIVTVIVVMSAIGMLSVGAVVYGVERARILSEIDERLEASLEAATALVAAGGPGGRAWASSTEALEAVVTRVSPDDNTGAVGVIGGRVALTPGVPLDVDLQTAPGFVGRVAPLEAVDPVIGTYAEEGVSWRYLVAPIAIQGSAAPERVDFVLAYDLQGELSEIDDPARVFLIAAAAAILVIAGTSGLVAARLLRPLRQMRETAERVSARSLAERLPVEGRDDVSHLAATMNDMLDRLDAALDTQRRLLSDVGHELKTPITIVSGHLEVMDADDPVDVRSTRELAIDELDRMGRLVQDLASEAALHGPAPLATTRTDAAELLASVARKARGIDGADVAVGTVATVTAPLDAARVTQALLQLTQNAVTHGGGRIELSSRVRGDLLELVVRDHGAGVPADQKERIFERFHRGDADSRGTGLGLSIVQMIARAHGGSARVLDASGGGAAFVIALPLSADDDPGADAPSSRSAAGEGHHGARPAVSARARDSTALGATSDNSTAHAVASTVAPPSAAPSVAEDEEPGVRVILVNDRLVTVPDRPVAPTMPLTTTPRTEE